MGVKKSDRIRQAMRDYGEPVRARDIATLAGLRADEVSTYMTYMVRNGEVRRVRRGVYALGDGRTLSEATGIEVRRDVKPVAPDAPKVELKPYQNNRTVSLLLEAIARSDDPKPYAGVIREIGDLLATS